MPLPFTSPDADAAERNAQNLSAWIDGSDADCAEEYLISDAGRATWDTYHLIGDVLRTPDLAIAPTPAFSGRMAEAMAAELPHNGVAFSRALSRSAWPAFVSAFVPGLALAAALALVVWVAWPFLSVPDAHERAVLAEVPRNSESNNAAAGLPDSGWHNYLDAHRQLVGPDAVRRVSFGSAQGRAGVRAGVRTDVVRTGASR